jgi:ankyrin repeat protein
MNSWYEKESLHFAAEAGNLNEVKELVARGYDVNAFDESLSFTPLHYAVRGGHIEVVKYLLSVGADVNAHEEGKIGETPLGVVAANCSYEMAQLLVKAGANPTIHGWMQLTALERARSRKKEEGRRVYELLLKTASSRSQISIKTC